MTNEERLKERLTDIRGWLIENIFRNDQIMFSNAREVDDIDLIEVIASLYNEYHNAVMGEPYNYMFHWANKCGSWVEEDLFDRVLMDEKQKLVKEIADFVGCYTCTNSLELADEILRKWGALTHDYT